MGDLNTFPVSFKVRGRRIVIIGGGEEALNKARLAKKTTGHVVVVSRDITADFTGCEVRPRPFAVSDLDGAALCFVADHGPDGEAAKAAARERGIPLNVVDVPQECDFYTPAIVDRAPLTVAIGTEGEAPVLARLVRARIEALLAPDAGRVARLAGSLRERVASLLNKAQARRFYEDLVTGDPGRDVGYLIGSCLADGAPARGSVWLIGAGPGAEDLLTLRAQRLLQEADVIVHDHLVPEAVIEMGRRDAERISVGKRMGHHSFTQARINALLVRLAREGKRVARLKGGDPMVFGRAGEEVEALRAAGIAYSIVPGVSAALAAAADTATPVTLRRVSSGIVFATAHGASNEELRHWAALAASGLTLALYMGKNNAAATADQLIGHGMAPTTPAGIVVNAGRSDRRFHRGTLGALTSEGLGEGPAVILVGPAVAAGDWTDAAEMAAEEFRAA